MGGGNNAGIRASDGTYVLLLNSDAWVVEATRSRGSRPSPTRIRAPPSSARGSATPTARSSARSAASRRCGGSRPSTCSSASSRPSTQAFNAFYGGGLRLRRRRARSSRSTAPRSSSGARRSTRSACSTRRSSCSARRPTGSTASGAAGWEVWFTPAAEVVHLGGASHGGRLYVENLRGILRFMSKNRGPRGGERGRACCCSGRCGCGRSLPGRARAGLPRRRAVPGVGGRPGAPVDDRRVPSARVRDRASSCFPASWSPGRSARGAPRRASPGRSSRSSPPGRVVFAVHGTIRLAAGILAGIGIARRPLRRARARPAGRRGA